VKEEEGVNVVKEEKEEKGENNTTMMIDFDDIYLVIYFNNY